MLRCSRCGAPIEKKPKAKTPKYCVPCRESLQQAYKENLKEYRRDRVRRR